MQNKDINYQAVVVKINHLNKINGLDNLLSTSIFGNNVLVSKDTDVDKLHLYFPPESRIGNVFLRYNNLFRDSNLNEDVLKKGYFELNGRVRVITMRGNPSAGFLCPLDYLYNAVDYKDCPKLEEGVSFNEIGDIKICTKYIPKTNKCHNGNPGGKAPIRKPSRYIKEHFKEHNDTEHLFRNIDRIPQNGLLVFSWKLHGTSMRCGNVVVNRRLTLLERLSRFLGAKIQETEYDFIVGSRTVIKDEKNSTTGYYEKDLWTSVSNSYFKDKLHKGEMIYAEIVGYVPGTQSLIQKGYTYGCEEGKCEVYVYRITNTNVDGVSIDLSWEALKQRCTQLGVKHIPEADGTVDIDLLIKLLKNNGTTLELWTKSKYLEKDCILQPDMPEEGICLRVEGLQPQIYKAKSFRFLELETKQLDTGEIDIESEQTEQETNG